MAVHHSRIIAGGSSSIRIKSSTNLLLKYYSANLQRVSILKLVSNKNIERKL